MRLDPRAQDAPAGRSSTGGGDDGKAVAALESRVLQVLSAMDKRVKAAESRAQAAEEAALRAAAETQALAAQVAELRTAAATRQHAPPPAAQVRSSQPHLRSRPPDAPHCQPAPAAAQDQWSANPFFDTAPQSAPPAHAPPASAPPPARHSGSSYGGAAPVSYGVTASSYGALPPAPHTAGAVSGSTRAQAAAAEQAAMDVINLIKTQPPAPGAGYMVGTDPSPAAARAAAALAQARARMRNREGGAPPASGGAPFEDGLSSVNRARALLDTIGAEGGVARRSQPAAPLAGLLAQAGADDLT